MKQIFFLSLLLISVGRGYAQRTERFEGGEGQYGGGFRYSVNSERISLKAFSALAYPNRLGGGIGYGKVGKKDRSWMLEADYYYNERKGTEKAHIINTSFTHYWSLVKLAASSRFLFGITPMIGYEYTRSMKIENAERHSFIYGFGVKLEYEHLFGDKFGMFVGVAQNVECLTKITQARLRHYIEAGVRIGLKK